MKVCIVGGGTSGIITGIILKSYLDIDVSIIYSESLGIIGVGEGVTEHFNEFMRFSGINNLDIIQNCDATLKSAVVFENWTQEPYMHNIGYPFMFKAGQYNYVYANQIMNNDRYMQPDSLWQNKISSSFLQNNLLGPFNQYHFDTFKLNNFLKDFAKKINIKFFEDHIIDVEILENGFIEKIIGKKKTYKSDFFIDCTGFSKLLINKLGAKWKSYSEYLHVNSAIVFQTPDEDEYNMWSYSRAMDYGWLFRTPVWGRYGNGYIFDSDFIDPDRAKIEAESVMGMQIKIGNTFKFDPGSLDRAWINNCCAIGLSAGFVEPMEATAIGSSIQQAFMLMHKITNYSQKDIDKYNKSYQDIMNNIRDFIIIHYLVDKKNTPFWEKATSSCIPSDLQDQLDVWENRLPILEDFNHLSDYIMFADQHFTLILDGIGFFNRKSIKKHHSKMSDRIKQDAINIINSVKNTESSEVFLSHKEYLSIIRSL